MDRGTTKFYGIFSMLHMCFKIETNSYEFHCERTHEMLQSFLGIFYKFVLTSYFLMFLTCFPNVENIFLLHTILEILLFFFFTVLWNYFARL
jgi:hypothetical protein